MPMETMRASEAAMAEPQFKERAFAEYHLYTLQGTTDVNQNETKQMSLFNANEIPAKKLFIYEDQGRIGWYGSGSDGSKKVNVKIEIENSKANNLGIPMPKGKVRVYKKDEDKALQFIGEDEIDHTPRDEKLRLYIGDAFDLVGERKQLSARSPSPRIQEYSYEISLRNHKEEAVTITAVEHTWGDWRILSASHAYKKKDSQTFEFTVDVPAGGEVKITYDIRVRT